MIRRALRRFWQRATAPAAADPLDAFIANVEALVGQQDQLGMLLQLRRAQLDGLRDVLARVIAATGMPYDLHGAIAGDFAGGLAGIPALVKQAIDAGRPMTAARAQDISRRLSLIWWIRQAGLRETLPSLADVSLDDAIAAVRMAGAAQPPIRGSALVLQIMTIPEAEIFNVLAWSIQQAGRTPAGAAAS